MKYRESSEMRGIKVKERVNYYIFGDEGTASQITISFDKDTNIWTVKAGGKHVPEGIITWYMNVDGVSHSYNYGETILTFNDGDEVSYMIMEQHRESIPYVNYMYDIISTPAGAEVLGTKDISIRVAKDPDEVDSCIFYKYEDSLIKAYKKMSATNVIEYKNRYKDIFPDNCLPVIFDAIKLDWHGMDPGPGFPQRSFQAISNNDYIYYNSENVPKGGTIKVWTPAEYEEFYIIDQSDKHKVKRSSKVLSSINLTKREGGSLKGNVSLDRESIFHDDFHTHKDVYYNGKFHKAMYLVYDNPTVDGCWAKKFESLCLTFADPNWYLMATKDGVEYNGTTYLARKLIKSWKKNTIVNLQLKETSFTKKPKTCKIEDGENFDMIVYGIQSVADSQTVTLVKIVGGKQKDLKTFDPTNGTVKFGNIQFKLNGNTWTVYSKCDYIKYNDTSYKDEDPIFTFDIYEPLTTQVYDESNRYFYDKIVYDILSIGGSTTVNVAKLVNEEEKDSINFTPEDRSVSFGNILFRIAGNSWTIYSKSAHIKYGGKTYLNNKPILSFEVGEQMHIQITDDTDEYEIKEVTEYFIKTPSESNVSYEVHTSETRRTMKVVKTNNGVEEPWVTVDYYDALYKPYMFKDISIKFYNNPMSWELFSNNDNLYYNGTNYKKGSSIATWGYYQNVKFDSIAVYHAISNLVQVQLKQSKTGNIIVNNEIDLDFGYFDEEDPDFNVSFSYYTGMWVIKALRNDIWCNGTEYVKGQTIISFKTKTNVPFLTIMAVHYDEESPEVPVNLTYSLSVNLEPLSGATSLTVSSFGNSDVTISDKNVSKGINENSMLSTNDAKSMYGYIWQREEEPIPPGDHSLYLLIALYRQSVGSAITSVYANTIPLRIRVKHKFTQSETPVTLGGHFQRCQIAGQDYVFWSRHLGYLPEYLLTNYGGNTSSIVYTAEESYSFNYGVLLENGEIVFCELNNIYKGYYTISVTGICTVTGISLISENFSYGYFLNGYVFMLSNSSFVCINFDDGFNESSSYGFKPGFRYINGRIEGIDGNKESLDSINDELSGYGCTMLAKSFDKTNAVKVGNSILANCDIGKYRPIFTRLDMSYFGQVIAEYDISSNSMIYYNKYSTKQIYNGVYKFGNKSYLATAGPTWTFPISQSPLIMSVDGDLNIYLYEIEDANDYIDISLPSKTFERTIGGSEIIPEINYPSMEFRRIDSNETITVAVFRTNTIESVSVKPGPMYSDYSDRIFFNLGSGIILVMDNPYWESSANNFAWSMDNYGIDEDYN